MALPTARQLYDLALQQSYSVAETLGQRGYRFCLNVEVFKFWKDGIPGPDGKESSGANPAFTLHINQVAKIEELARSDEDILRLVDSAVKYGAVGDLTEVKVRESEMRSSDHIRKLEERLAEMQRRLDLQDGSKSLDAIEKPKMLDAEEPPAPPPERPKHWKTLAKEARDAAMQKAAAEQK